MPRPVASRLPYVGICLLVLSAGCAGSVPGGEQPSGDAAADVVTVTGVVDGDTVRVRYADGRTATVRLLGVDAPEVRGRNDAAEFEGVPATAAGRECLAVAGSNASDYAEARLAGRRVRLVSDPAADRRDQFDRVLAYVVVDGEQFNYALVRDGHARLYDTDFAERERYAAAEREAREARRGLWSCVDAAATTDGGTEASGPLSLAAHPDAAGDDDENLGDEYVVLRNVGEKTLDLSGWTVSDAAGKTYTFGEGTRLEPGATVTLYTGAGSDTEGVRYWGRDGAVWNNDGDTVTVRDAAGDVVLRQAV
jgi:micrococcal nuclease